MAHLAIAGTQHDDSAVWGGDCVELLLETTAHSYYQIAVNPAGMVVDADREQRIDTRWSSGVQVAVHRAEGFWSVEVRLPLATELQATVDAQSGIVGLLPSRTYPWYFNVCRQRVRDGKTELSAFALSKGGQRTFHDKASFAELITPK